MRGLWVGGSTSISTFIFSPEIDIDIFEERQQYRKKWHSDDESYESKDRLWNKEDKKRDKNRKVHIRRNDFWIEIVRFYGVDNNEHDHTGEHDNPLISGYRSISISDDNNRDSGDEHSEYRYKPKDKNDGRESKYIGKWLSPMNKTNTYKTQSCQECIYEGDEHLCLHNTSKPLYDFFSNECVLVIEESETPSTHTVDETPYHIALHEKYIWEDESDKYLDDNPSDITELNENFCTEIFYALRIDDTTNWLCESEIYPEWNLCFFYHFIQTRSEKGCLFREIMDFTRHKGNNTDECEYDSRDKNNIEWRNGEINMLFRS